MHPRKDPNRCCLRVNQWPAADLQLWRAARRPGDVLEGNGRAAHWAAHTADKVEKGYGRWLTWLAVTGYLTLPAPADRVTRANVAAYVVDLQALNAPYTVLARVQELYQAVSAMLPERDWTWIRRMELSSSPDREPCPPQTPPPCSHKRTWCIRHGAYGCG